jgi:hypothetical protein
MYVLTVRRLSRVLKELNIREERKKSFETIDKNKRLIVGVGAESSAILRAKLNATICAKIKNEMKPILPRVKFENPISNRENKKSLTSSSGLDRIRLSLNRQKFLFNESNKKDETEVENEEVANKSGVEKFKSVVNKQRLVNKAVLAFKVNRETYAMKNEQKAVKVLGIVFVIFLIAWGPFAILNILGAVLQSTQYYIPHSHSVISFLTWLGYISSSINPIVYNSFNEKFRYAFKQILKCNFKALKKHQDLTKHNQIMTKLASQSFLLTPRLSERSIRTSNQSFLTYKKPSNAFLQPL